MAIATGYESKAGSPTKRQGAGGFRLWREWIYSCALGELLGIGVAAIFAVLIYRAVGEPDTLSEKLVTLFAMVFAGSLEGLSVGFFQWRVLRRKFNEITVSSWLTATVAVAAFGWFAGMLYPTFFAASELSQTETSEMPAYLTALFAAVFGIAVGAVFGGAQWIVLRLHARNAAQWILGNSLGWAAALVWIYLAASLPSAETPMAITAVIGAGAGILAGLSVGAITGIFLLRLKLR